MGTCGSSGLRQPHSSDGSGAVRQRRTPISCPERQQRHLILLGAVRGHLIWPVGRLRAVVGIVERLVPDELWELFQRVVPEAPSRP